MYLIQIHSIQAEKISDIFTILSYTNKSTNKVSEKFFSTQETEEQPTLKPKSKAGRLPN
jgi:hypothetical protein